VDATVNNRGVYSDAGGRDLAGSDVVFDDCEWCCWGANADDSAATTSADFTFNEYSLRGAACVRFTTSHFSTVPGVEGLVTDGSPPRRLLSQSTIDDVATFTGQAVTFRALAATVSGDLAAAATSSGDLALAATSDGTLTLT
jgi:hypothetical protein